jgi:hypothetical protein
MEKLEFIAEAKKLGMEDSVIQGRLELHEEFDREGTPVDFECFLGPFINPSDIGIFAADSPAPAAPT